jgi:hypothetical protein
MHQSNSNQSDFRLGILPKFEREPENAKSHKNGIAGTSESQHQSHTIAPLPLQSGLPCSLIQCMWNLIKLSPYFPLIKPPLISARLHSRCAPSTAACFHHSTRYHQKRRISGARDQGGQRRATAQGGNTEAVNQGGNRREVESEWRKVMRINEGGKTRKTGSGRRYSVGRDRMAERDGHQ